MIAMHRLEDHCHVFECDVCEAEYRGEPGDIFNDVWKEAEKAGWRSRKIGHDWAHACPRCKL